MLLIKSKVLTSTCSEVCLLRNGERALACFRHQPLGLGEGGRAPLAHLLVVCKLVNLLDGVEPEQLILVLEITI